MLVAFFFNINNSWYRASNILFGMLSRANDYLETLQHAKMAYLFVSLATLLDPFVGKKLIKEDNILFLTRSFEESKRVGLFDQIIDQKGGIITGSMLIKLPNFTHSVKSFTNPNLNQCATSIPLLGQNSATKHVCNGPKPSNEQKKFDHAKFSWSTCNLPGTAQRGKRNR